MRDQNNALGAVFDLAFTSSGILQPNTVNEASLQNRIVTTNKRAFLSNFYYAATGSGDALVIANAVGLELAAYAAGHSFFVKAPSENTGAATLKVDALAVRAIKKLDGQDLDAGDIPNGGVIQVVDQGTFYILIGAVANLQRPRYVTVQGSPTATALVDDVTETLVGEVSLPLPAGCTEWKHVKVCFGTMLLSGASSIKDILTKIGATVQDINRGGANFASNRSAGSGAANQNISNDNFPQVTYIAEGVPSTPTASTLKLDVYAKKGTGAGGETIASRAVYAFGIAT